MASNIYHRSTNDLSSSHAIPQDFIPTPRTEPSTHNTRNASNNIQTCITLTRNQIIISRTTLIATLTAFALITFISLLLLLVFIYRAYQRRKQIQAARTWGHKSHFHKRISLMRKEIDDAYTRQYGPGCLMNPIPENPEMGSDSPVEMMPPERVWEVPARTRKSKAKSLFFDHRVGVWMPKR